MRHWRELRHWAGALTAVILLSASVQPQAAAAQVGTAAASAEDIFTNSHVPRIQIDITAEGIAALRQTPRSPWGDDGERVRPKVKAVVREGGKVYSEVSVHLKGAAGSFQSIDDRPGFTLNFDKHIKGQTFYGLERISLNNSVQDPSLLNEAISRELFAAAGIPVPRAGHATVELNGRDLGVYVLTEAFNKQFLSRHFSSPKGNLYDGGFLRDITDELEKSSGPNPNDRSDLRQLAEAAMQENPTNRVARLNEVLDLDRFITYLALDVMLCDWDGYGMNRNNYRVYHDPGSDKIVFMPHGLDQMFGVMRANTGMSIFPRMSGLVAKAVLQTPATRERYRDRIAELANSLYNVETITNRVWKLAARVRPALAERRPDAVRSHEREVAALCRRIAERRQSIDKQLATPKPTLAFDTAGVARFEAWKSRADHGQPVLDEAAEFGKKMLRISAENGSCVGIWFTKVQLEPGDYRFEARIKSAGVIPDVGDRRGGAGLRISGPGRRFTQKVTGDTGWTDIGVDFKIQDLQSEFAFMTPVEGDAHDVELICELRAAKGQVWFDAGSLRLLRK